MGCGLRQGHHSQAGRTRLAISSAHPPEGKDPETQATEDGRGAWTEGWKGTETLLREHLGRHLFLDEP